MLITSNYFYFQEYYSREKKHCGFCHVINVDIYDKKTESDKVDSKPTYGNRTGSDIDVENIEGVFKDMDFVVDTHKGKPKTAEVYSILSPSFLFSHSISHFFLHPSFASFSVIPFSLFFLIVV